MNYQVMDIKAETYEEPAKLYLYLQEKSPEIAIDKRPLIFICPGGAYAMTSDREAEAVALQFLAAGFHAAVLRYSVAPARYPTALLQVAAGFKYLREHAEEFHIDEDKIVIQGASAGGHLAASYGVFWKKKTFLAEMLHTTPELLKPNGMMLSYPVITSGPKAHRGSFENLLGDRYEELVEEMSLEKQVDADTPPAFLWHTTEDDCVPVENSLLFYQALHDQGISVEMHIYPLLPTTWSANELTAAGDGFGIQPECATWIEHAKTWMKSSDERSACQKIKKAGFIAVH